MIRLVFCDLDGTVRGYDGTITPAVCYAMQAVIGSGKRITISTGRGYQSFRPVVPAHLINAPTVSCNGGLILDENTRQVLMAAPTPLSLTHRLVRVARQEGIRMAVYFDDLETMVDNRQDPAVFVLTGDGHEPQVVTDPMALITRPPIKLGVFVDSPEESERVIRTLKPLVAGEAIVVSSGPRTVEVILDGITKASGMAWLANHLGVPREETMAIGDMDNDIDMIEWAGVGVAMGNATPALKAVADWVAPPVTEDGLAVALERFALPQGLDLRPHTAH